jgi:hypothetical protein
MLLFCRRNRERKMNIVEKMGLGNNSFNKVFYTIMIACLLSMVSQTACFATTVTLQWDSNTDANLSGYKVYYQADSSTTPFKGTGATPTLVSKTTTSATISGLDSAHAYYFAVTAYNTSGVESAYSNIVYVPELQAPTVSISYPANKASVGGTVSVTASASDNVGITKVEFYLNGALQATDTSSPYLYSWNTSSLAAGSYTVMAKAYDAALNVGQSTNVSVTIVKDSTAPSVSMSAPANNAILSGSVTISANASDAVGVKNVEFYLDSGALLTATNVSPFSYKWNTTSITNATHTLYAKAYDTTGNVGQSPKITVTVNNPVSDNIAPTVSVTAPASNAKVSGTTSVTATASDNVGVSRVEFYVNGVVKATDTASPYTYSWNTTTIANGSYTLYAKAYDAANNVKQSASVTVTVNNTVAVPSSYTVWPSTAVPGVADIGPDNPVELGVKFRSDSNGYITSIRFYKASANTGTHVGNLWTSSGTKLATATFTNETASGWQQVNFSTPVAITANTVYVASYHTNTGHYSDDKNFFSSKGVDNAPLHLLANGVSGSNGVYAYVTSSSFPNKSWISSNYWVDVVFSSAAITSSAATTSSDSIPPTVSIVSPVNNATVTGIQTVTSSASDIFGVTKVEFYVNGSLQTTDTTSPYTFSWNTASIANGSYTLSTKAYDAAGNVGKSSNVSVTVANAATVANDVNIAPQATVTASSQNTSTGQTASKAVDGVIDGYGGNPGDSTKEWATMGQLAGAWIQLKWSKTFVVDKIVLYDRPNTDDQVLGGTLTFSDGTSVAVGQLTNNGTGNTISFTPKTVSWIKFTTTNAQGLNIGLSEFQVFGH